jgi:cell division transport system permease protein
VPTTADADVVELLAASYETKPGVRQVVRATEQIKKIQDLADWLRFFVLIAAIVLLLAALLLILNTIRMAMFARRREIEVMKLVGATNLFILVPFMIEGTVAGILGALLATGAVRVVHDALATRLADPDLALFTSFAVDSGEVWTIGLLLLGVGALVGAVGSAIAAYRFLDV